MLLLPVDPGLRYRFPCRHWLSQVYVTRLVYASPHQTLHIARAVVRLRGGVRLVVEPARQEIAKEPAK